MHTITKCSICLESFQANQPISIHDHPTLGDFAHNNDNEDHLIRLKCDHLFHRGCFHDWALTCQEKGTHTTCPNCRFEVIKGPEKDKQHLHDDNKSLNEDDKNLLSRKLIIDQLVYAAQHQRPQQQRSPSNDNEIHSANQQVNQNPEQIIQDIQRIALDIQRVALTQILRLEAIRLFLNLRNPGFLHLPIFPPFNHRHVVANDDHGDDPGDDPVKSAYYEIPPLGDMSAENSEEMQENEHTTGTRLLPSSIKFANFSLLAKLHLKNYINMLMENNDTLGKIRFEYHTKWLMNAKKIQEKKIEKKEDNDGPTTGVESLPSTIKSKNLINSIHHEKDQLSAVRLALHLQWLFEKKKEGN